MLQRTLHSRIAAVAVALPLVAFGAVATAQPAQAAPVVDCLKGVSGPDPQVARAILKVGHKLHAPRRVIFAAFQAAWVESRVNNCSNGDGTSAGVFQQINSGWGSYEQRTDPHFAARSFFVHAIRYWKKHPTASAGTIAQGVQRSAYPLRYDQCRELARALMVRTMGHLARELAKSRVAAIAAHDPSVRPLARPTGH